MATITQRPAQGHSPNTPRVVGGIALILVATLLTLGIRQKVCTDSLTAWVSLAVTGFRLGAIYAMIALGYTLVYGVLQLLNFAHSEVFMVGSFAGLYSFTKLLGVNAGSHPNGVGGLYLVVALGVGILLAALASGLTAVTMERVAYRPLRRHGASRLAYLITAIGVSLFLSNLFLLLDGGKHLGLPFRWPRIGGAPRVEYPLVMRRFTLFKVLGVPIDNLTILLLGISLVMLIVLDMFVRRTKAGKGIRAVAEDPDTASIMGVDINGIIVLTFFVGGLMAGVAGILYGLFFNFAQFNMGFIPGIKAFTAAVLGGIGNIRGAVLGGILLGLIENLGVACTSAQWQTVIAFMVLVGVLMFRPTGLLGERVGG